MEIDGTYGHLNDEEMQATGLASPILLSEVDTVELIAKLDERTAYLDHLSAADDDDLTHAERASILPEKFRLASDRRIIEEMAGQVTAHEVELFMQQNG